MSPLARNAEIRRRLLRWYRKNRRDLPWRRTRDPFAIWVSEIMLQQTRVEAAIPYYRKFLRRFPDVESLAKAPLNDVLALWSGLGYYRRARSLHAAVREIRARYNGKIPADYDSFHSLPGVGPYTAGAVMSIAFRKAVPLLDGNVIRLLSRLHALRGDPTRSRNRERLWEISRALVPAKEPGNFNQALMELPALICVPQKPRCEECPLENLCQARRLGLAGVLPERRQRPPSRRVDLQFLCWEKKGKYFLLRRREEPMAGMWEFPSVGREGMPKGAVFHGQTRHAIMDRRIRARYFVASAAGRRFRRGRWIGPRESEDVPITTLTRKGLALIDRR